MPTPGSEVANAMNVADAARARAMGINGVAIDESHSPQQPPDIDEERSQFLPVRKLREQYIDFLYTKVDEIEEQKLSRHYYHGAHWTPEQINVLRRRHQPPVTWNHTARRINGIVGLIERYRTDPKALPRSPRAEAGAEIATQSIRYVLDSNEFK